MKNYHKEIIVKPAKRLLAALKQSENDVKKAITEFLEWQGWTVYRINNIGVFRRIDERGNKKYSFAGAKGVPDLYATKPHNKPLWIEFKATGKKPTKEQWAFIHKTNDTDHAYGLWADSLDMFSEIYHDLQLGYGLPKSMINTEAK